MERKQLDVDVVVLGGGCVGLFIAWRLLQRGYSVALIERNRELANSPSTRNEGWLHAGTYGAVAIDDAVAANIVAQRCQYGFNIIERHFPDALVQEWLTPTLAVLTNTAMIDHVVDRWNFSGVQYREVSNAQAKKEAPEFLFPEKCLTFKVQERSMDTRYLLDSVLRACQAYPTFHLMLHSHAFALQENTVLIEDWDTADPVGSVTAHTFIYSAGAGIADLVQRFHNQSLDVRAFKTPLIVAERILGANIVCLMPQ
ncbi:FAD-dependent oxidoreductase [Armatimonas sp.]|uniref:FAD-dependent oxidoreductase n=1 Tax=Armatimonas sp. TaxID=1872638 RepID=UPI00375387C0